MNQERQFRELLDGVLTGRVSRREIMKRATALGLSASAVSTLWLAQLGVPIARAQDATPMATPEAEVTPGGVLRMAMQSDPSALDPQTLSLTAIWHVVEHIYETLMRIQPDLTVTPSLAESVDISEDGLVYTFNLRQGVTFHDGTPFTADDVLFTYTRLLLPETGSQSTTDVLSIRGAAAVTAGEATEVEGIRVVDPNTLEITLEAPDASFLTSIANPATSIYSRAFVEANNNDVSQVANGTGPFMLDEYIPATSLTYSKNPNYWDAGLPYLDGLEMVIASEDTARTGALVQGSVDFIEYAPLRDVDTLAANPELKIAGDSNTNIRFLGFNLTREPFTNPQVRQAISMVVDRGPIIEAAVFGKGTAVATIFPPDFWAALPVEPSAPDIAGAQALMEQAGFADGFDTTITSWAEYSFLSDAAVVLQEQLRAININAELNLVDTGTMGQMVYVDKDFDLAVTGTSAYVDPHGLILENFGTGNSGNFVSYSNPQVDELILAGQTETETEARAEIYRQIQEILLQDLPWVNFFVANQFEAMKQSVMGYDHIATGSNVSIRKTWIQS